MTNRERIYFGADKIAKANQQTVGDKNEFYITLEQLMTILEMVSD